MAALLSVGCGDASPYPTPQRSSSAEPANATPARRTATAPSHGFNDSIAWRPLDEGLAESQSEGRPVMLVVHASWCGRCKELKPAFQDPRLAELSEQFVMVNADQDLTPDARRYAPDGTYIPRIMFLDPATGQLDPTLQNPGRTRHHYYFGPNDNLTDLMQKALARHGKS